MDQLIHQITRLAQKYHMDKLVLFGSRARGDHSAHSDIDIAIWGVPKAETSLLSSELHDLDTLLKIDTVFVDTHTNPELVNNIKKDGIVLMDKLQIKKNNFKSALQKLTEAITEYETTKSLVVRDGVIQRFEFTTELSWKCTKDFLEDEGYTDINSPKSAMKTAFSHGLIADEKAWISLLNDRNVTSHIYDEHTAALVYDNISEVYIRLFSELTEKLDIK